MDATVGAIALVGLEPRAVRVECVKAPGLPQTRIVGLPDTAVREAADRVKAAIVASELEYPGQKVIVNLAPAALRKAGAGFDLPMALAIVAASGALPPEATRDLWACGELGLDGTARPVPGILPVADAVRRLGGRRLLVPERGAVEASLVDGLEVIPVRDLSEAFGVLRGLRLVRETEARPELVAPPVPDLRDVRGQPLARRAVEIAAAGGHHLLLVGPPGCGKSMLAERLPGLLPELSVEAALEVAAVHSVAGIREPDAPLSCVPPFRAPHHGTSAAGLIGGGSGIARPGELSLAHHGVLFLDELLESPRHVLDALRQPLERGSVTITRAYAAVHYPARVLLVAATNPCPCGHLGSSRRPCRCRPDRIERYRARLSGPLLDRIDVQVELRPVEREAIEGEPDGEPTAVVAERVAAARAAAAERWGPDLVTRDVPPQIVRRSVTPAALRSLAAAIEHLRLSARGFDRALRVARTIADLGGSSTVEVEHVEEAVAYRLAVPEPVA